MPIRAICRHCEPAKQSGALYIFWIASFLAMTASADGRCRRHAQIAGSDGKRNGFASSFFLFAKLF
ncbi:MAG: hypothetical protein LBT42_08880 [Tannerella sp.]|nr:hypothetical protein [Tannerella sp.]